MICEKCHQEYDGNMTACPYCGNASQQPQPEQPQYQQQPQPEQPQYQQQPQQPQPEQPQYQQQPQQSYQQQSYQQQSYQQQPPQYQPQYAQQPQGGAKGMSIAAMVCGIIGLVLCWIPFVGLIINAMAIIFYILSRKETPNGMATAGLVCGIIGLVVALIMTILVGVVWSAVTSPWYWY